MPGKTDETDTPEQDDPTATQQAPAAAAAAAPPAVASDVPEQPVEHTIEPCPICTRNVLDGFCPHCGYTPASDDD